MARGRPDHWSRADDGRASRRAPEHGRHRARGDVARRNQRLRQPAAVRPGGGLRALPAAGRVGPRDAARRRCGRGLHAGAVDTLSAGLEHTRARRRPDRDARGRAPSMALRGRGHGGHEAPLGDHCRSRLLRPEGRAAGGGRDAACGRPRLGGRDPGLSDDQRRGRAGGQLAERLPEPGRKSGGAGPQPVTAGGGRDVRVGRAGSWPPPRSDSGGSGRRAPCPDRLRRAGGSRDIRGSRNARGARREDRKNPPHRQPRRLHTFSWLIGIRELQLAFRFGEGRYDDQHHTKNLQGVRNLSNESGAVLTQSEEELEQDESAAMTMEDYLHYEEEAFKTPNHGDIVDGIVVRVDPDEVLVDIGAKAEGVISSKELGLRGEADSLGLEPGDQIKVFVLQPENEEGNVVLSLRRARAETTWLVAAEKQTDGSVIDADVREQNKGGLIVNVLGLRGFLPSSQVARAYAGSLESLVGQRIAVKILEVNRKRNRLIVSQKAAEDEDRARKREELFSRLQTGSTVKGTVSGITSYGAFVDIGGADGLIHISELSWDRVSKVTDVLQLGEEVTVKVIKLDPEQTRISLSLRQLQQDPWEKLVQSMPIGSIVEGQVTKTKKYGAFLQIMPGIEGLLHISELSWDHVERTEDVLKVGETLQVKVIGIDTARRRISLSLKQLSAPPASLAGAARPSRQEEYFDPDDES